MRIPHVAIRGAAATAALVAGVAAGGSTASAGTTARPVHRHRKHHRHGSAHEHAKAHHRHGKAHHEHAKAHHRHGKAHHGHGKAHHEHAKTHHGHGKTHHGHGKTHHGHGKTHHGHGTGHQHGKSHVHGTAHGSARCWIVARAKHRWKCRVLTITGSGAQHTTRGRKRHPVRPVAAPAAQPPAPAAVPAPQATAPATVQPAGVSGSWNLVFDDEFNGSAINTSVWNEHDGWANQNNVTDHASNVAESGGVATLTLASSSSGATIGTNQGVLAVGDFAEARVDFAGAGTTIYSWPAWWASGPNWPAAGENDIAEGLGTLTVNYHSPSGAHNEGTVAGDWAGAFHTFGIYRGAGYCNVYWDGQLVRHYSTDDNGQAQQLLFTMGAANQLQFGAAGEMRVDYVRVWAPA